MLFPGRHCIVNLSSKYGKFKALTISEKIMLEWEFSHVPIEHNRKKLEHIFAKWTLVDFTLNYELCVLPKLWQCSTAQFWGC